jgi:biotin carboxylase
VAEENAEGLVVLIGSGMRAYREYLVQGASRHCPLWLVDEQEASWQLPYLYGSSVVGKRYPSRLVPELEDLYAAVAAIAGSHRVAGLFTYDEVLVTATAHIADRLGLPGLSTEAAERCRNKPRTRLALTAVGLPQPRFAVSHTAAEAARSAAAIGYPVVLKPRGMAASVGVVQAASPAGLAEAFGTADRASYSGPAAYEGGVLVEELIDGPEISVDGAVVAGEYLPFCLARKQLGPPPYFEEVGHVVDATDPLLADAELRRVLRETHRALGVRYGVTHTEVRLSSRGPVVIEVNARLGGDLIPYVGRLATGVDPGRVAAQVCSGERPDLTTDRAGCVGIRFLYPPEDCRVTSVRLPEPGAVPGLLAAGAIAQPGEAVRLPPRAHIGRHAYVICTAADGPTCEARLERAAALVDLAYEPLQESELVGDRPW